MLYIVYHIHINTNTNKHVTTAAATVVDRFTSVRGKTSSDSYVAFCYTWSFLAISARRTCQAMTADGRSPPPAVDTVLGHAFTCACQLVAFAAIVYVLSARCGVRVVFPQASVYHDGGRRAACLQHPYYRGSDAFQSEPGRGGAAADGAGCSDDYNNGHTTTHRRRRKIRSAAPLLQR